MPYRLNWEAKGVHLEFLAHVTGQEIKEAGDAMYGHEGFDQIRYQIFDFAAAETFTLSIDDMREIAAIDLIAARTNPRIRLAIVSTSETIDTAIAFYDANSPDLPWETQGFRGLPEARAWISEE